MNRKLLFFLCCFFTIPVFAQQEKDPLFSKADPLDIAISMSIKEIKNSKVDSVYFKHKMYYHNDAGANDSIKIGLKRRGNFRLRECYFPPLWMKIDKKNAANTLFEGNRKLKLVLPCNSGSGSNELILREYVCYKLYETVTSDCFKTRLVNAAITVENGKKTKDYQLKGILIEDLDKAAKRSGSKAASDAAIPPQLMNDTCALRFALFQLLIANTDFSKSHQHNSKLIYRHAKYIPLPYDFDMSGVVEAPYAVVSQVGEEQLPISHVTERYYRGHCASAETTQFVRQEFLANEEKLLAVPDLLNGSLPDKQIKNMKSYLAGFFEILKDDSSFKHEVLDRCRPK